MLYRNIKGEIHRLRVTNLSKQIIKQEFDLHSVDSQPEAMDIIYSRIRDLIATSGNSALLSISERPSIANVKASELLQASKNDYLTKQFEQFLNEIINSNFDLKYQWEVYLFGDIFFWQDEAKMLKEMILNGATSFLPQYLAHFGMTVESYKGCELLLDSLDIELKRDDQEYEEANAVGRPGKNENDIENDNTAISRDEGNNVSEIKQVSSSKFVVKDFSEGTCIRCGAELHNEEDCLCDECLEEMYQTRLEETYSKGFMKRKSKDN